MFSCQARSLNFHSSPSLHAFCNLGNALAFGEQLAQYSISLEPGRDFARTLLHPVYFRPDLAVQHKKGAFATLQRQVEYT